jgi:hypothetical protein
LLFINNINFILFRAVWIGFFLWFRCNEYFSHDERAVDIADAMRFHDAAIVRREGYELAGADLND